MKSSSFRQVIVAMTIAVSAATVHGAWFASTDARETAPVITISTWDYYEKSWTSATHDLAADPLADPLTVRHSEDTIVAITGASLSLPTGLNATTLDGPALDALEIPQVVGAGQYLYLRVSKPLNLAGSWPVPDPTNPWSGPTNPWSGPTDPQDVDLSALDVDGSVGVFEIPVGTAKFTWDISRWSKGDIFLGLGNHTYKVLDRNGNFKRFVASADLDQGNPAEVYNSTTGCATNWKTGEMFATNFGDYYPAVNIIGRHPQVEYEGDRSPYSSPSRRISTRVDRTDDVLGTNYKHPYTSVNYPIDVNPESVAFDADLNLFVGHSIGNYRQAPKTWETTDTLFSFGSQWSQYAVAVDGLPLEVWPGEGWPLIVDETGTLMKLAPAGSPTEAHQPQSLGESVSPRLAYQLDGGRAVLAMSTAGELYPTALSGLPGWTEGLALPDSFLSNPVTGAEMHRLTGTGSIDLARIRTRKPLGKRLHKYRAQTGGGYVGSEGGAAAQREAFWTFTGRQGTDWIDLDVTGEVMYYTSEDSFIHRYRVKTGSAGQPVGQLPDVGADLVLDGQPTFGKLAVAQSASLGMNGGTLANYRFHGMRILPPGDGSGGFIVAVGFGLGVHRFNADGKWVQRYWAQVDHDSNSATRETLVGDWYTLAVDPGGKSFWASAFDTGWIVQFDIASGRELKKIKAVDYLPYDSPGMPAGRSVTGICIMWQYATPQEICFDADGKKQGKDDDGDGYTDENCVAIEVCSAVSPSDDDGDKLSDQYDPDCSPELPPVAIDDAYVMNQQASSPNPTVLKVDVSDGVLKRGNDDYDRDSVSDGYAESTLTVIAGGTDQSTLAPLSSTTVTSAKGGSVVLRSDGSFDYTPDSDFHGRDTFAYRISDGFPVSTLTFPIPDREIPSDRADAGEDDIAIVTIIVEPKVADDGPYQVWVGETVSRLAVDTDGLLANDAQSSSASLAGPVTIEHAWDPQMSGAVALVNGTRTFPTDLGNLVTVNADGSFSFKAQNLDFSGLDTFSYDVHDTVSRSWNIATVTFEVRRPVITVVVPDQNNKTYDGAPLPTTCTVTSDRVAEPIYSLTYAGTILGGAPYSSTTIAPTAAGTYTATCVHTDLALGARRDTGSIVINPVPLTITAADTSRAYFAPNPTVPRTITGFVNGETESVLAGTTSCSTSVAETANVGTYANANTCSATLSATNYTFSYVPGDLTITGLVLTVTASDTSRAYLAPNPTVPRTITGFVNGETESVLAGTTSCSTSVAETANVGTYANANTCSATLSATNYTISYVPGDLTISGLVLTVTASNTEKFYGEPNAPVSYTITGFQGTDDVPSVVNGSTTCSTAGGPNAGTYTSANTCTQTLTATNYSFVYVPGSLVIKTVPLIVTAASTSKVYGDATPTVTRTITGFKNGDDAADLGGTSVCSAATSAGPNVGTYNAANTCTQALTSANYTFGYVAGNFSITPRPLTAKANDKTIVLGSPLPALDGTLTGGVVTGDVINVTYASTNSGEEAGVYPGVLIPTVTSGGNTLLTNYTVTETAGTLTVLKVAPCSGNDGYITYSQGGWGSRPSGSNPGALLARHFATVYPGGVLIGAGYTLSFTTAKAIEDFLPGGGTSKPLTAIDVNPRRSAAGNIAAQLLALRLATDFSAAGITKRGLGALVMQSGPLAGRTVDQILTLANSVVGGQPNALPSGLSISGLASILESLNLNYHEGTVNQGLLSCTGGTPGA